MSKEEHKFYVEAKCFYREAVQKRPNRLCYWSYQGSSWSNRQIFTSLSGLKLSWTYHVCICDLRCSNSDFCLSSPALICRPWIVTYKYTCYWEISNIHNDTLINPKYIIGYEYLEYLLKDSQVANFHKQVHFYWKTSD